MKIALTGGGNDYNFSINEIVASALKNSFSQKNEEMDLLIIGGKNSNEEKFSQEKGLNFKSVPYGKIRTSFSLQSLIAYLKIIAGFIKAFFILLGFKPNVLFSSGGEVSRPVSSAAGLLGIPIVIHEQTVQGDKANLGASKRAKKICLSFSSSTNYFPKSKSIITGYPVSDEVLSGSKENCIKKYGLNPDIFTIFITGGREGAHKLNLSVKPVLKSMLKKANVIQECGESHSQKDYETLKTAGDAIKSDEVSGKYVLLERINGGLGDIIAACDTLVCRNEADIVGLITAFAIPPIMIPQSATSGGPEQLEIAQAIEREKAGVIIQEKDLNESSLMGAILYYLDNSERFETVKKTLEKDNTKDSTKKIIETLKEVSK